MALISTFVCGTIVNNSTLTFFANMFLFFYHNSNEATEWTKRRNAMLCIYNLWNIYCVTNFAIRYSTSIAVVLLFRDGRARKRVPVISTIFCISYRRVIPRNTHGAVAGIAFAKARDCKIQSAIAVPLISRYSARIHIHTHILIRFLFLRVSFHALRRYITPLRTASRAITAD